MEGFEEKSHQSSEVQGVVPSVLQKWWESVGWRSSREQPSASTMSSTSDEKPVMKSNDHQKPRLGVVTVPSQTLEVASIATVVPRRVRHTSAPIDIPPKKATPAPVIIEHERKDKRYWYQ
jgi:hypothetical protein